MNTMDCTRALNLLSDYQDGALDAAEAAALAAHLRGCGECAGHADSLLAMRKMLRVLPPDPAPPELLAGVLAAVDAEARGARADSAPVEPDAARPFLSRFRIPLEAAAALLLFASVYWYRQSSAPPVRPPAAPVAQAPAAQAPDTTPRVRSSPEASPGAAGIAASGNRLPRGIPKTAKKEEAPPAATPRTWTEAELPSAPAIRASSNSERIVPVAPPPGPTADPAGPGALSSGERQGAGAEGGPDVRLVRSFAPPPLRLLRPLTYGRDIVVDVTPESREGAEERIAVAALRLGGIYERIIRGPGESAPGASGTVRVILPEIAATRFLEEIGRIGTIPPEENPAATGLPAGPRPGTVAYAVHIRVR